MFKQAKEISDDKVNIAVHTYELVDKHIRKLDSDLAKFESEMKVCFYVSTFKVNQKGVTPPPLALNFAGNYFLSRLTMKNI